MQLSPRLAAWPALRCPSYLTFPTRPRPVLMTRHGRVLRQAPSRQLAPHDLLTGLRRPSRPVCSALLIWPPGAALSLLSATASRGFTGVHVDRAKSAAQEKTESLTRRPPSFREHSACLRRSLLTGSAGTQPSWKRYSHHKTHTPLVLHIVYCDTTTPRQSQPTATLACPPRRQGPSVRYHGQNPLDLRRRSAHLPSRQRQPATRRATPPTPPFRQKLSLPAALAIRTARPQPCGHSPTLGSSPPAN